MRAKIAGIGDGGVCSPSAATEQMSPAVISAHLQKGTSFATYGRPYAEGNQVAAGDTTFLSRLVAANSPKKATLMEKGAATFAKRSCVCRRRKVSDLIDCFRDLKEREGCLSVEKR